MLGYKSATIALDQYGNLLDDGVGYADDRLNAAADAFGVSNSQHQDSVRSLTA